MIKRYLLPNRPTDIKLAYEMGVTLLRTTDSYETLEEIRKLLYSLMLSMGTVVEVADSRKSKTAKEQVVRCHYDLTAKTQVIEAEESDVDNLRKLIKAFEKALVENYREGKKDGQSILIGLNSGDITMKDFEAEVKEGI